MDEVKQHDSMSSDREILLSACLSFFKRLSSDTKWLYLFETRSVVFDVIRKEDEHTEFTFHIWQLNHFEIHFFHDENWKCVSHVHHLYRLGLVLESIFL